MSSKENSPDAEKDLTQAHPPTPNTAILEADRQALEEQISATLSNIQLSRGVADIDVNEDDFTEEDVEKLEEVLAGCDHEYNNLFATLDQLGSCLDEVENRNDTLNTRVDELLSIMEKTQVERETSLKNWTNEANKVMEDLNKIEARNQSKSKPSEEAVEEKTESSNST